MAVNKHFRTVTIRNHGKESYWHGNSCLACNSNILKRRYQALGTVAYVAYGAFGQVEGAARLRSYIVRRNMRIWVEALETVLNYDMKPDKVARKGECR